MKNIEILFEDEYCIVINKPHGLLSIPDRFDLSIPNVKNTLLKRDHEVYTVHRIDKNTSGILLFAKSNEAHKRFCSLWENNKVIKKYMAICQGSTNLNQGEITANIIENKNKKGTYKVHSTGKPSTTLYKIIDRYKSYITIELQLVTGRTHQIRVHLHHIGLPVVGDPKYGTGKPFLVSNLKGKKYNHRKSQDFQERPLINRHALHASQIEFLHPLTNESHVLTAPLPKDMSAVLKQLDKWNSLK